MAEGRRVYLNFLDPEPAPQEDFGDLYKRRVGTSLDPEDYTVPPEVMGEKKFDWPDKMPFPPKGQVEQRTTERFIPGAKGSALAGGPDLPISGSPDLTESMLRNYGMKSVGPSFDPIRPLTPLGRAIGGEDLDRQIAAGGNADIPFWQKSEVNYSTALSPSEEKDYRAWAKKQGKNPDAEEKDYDLRGYYKDVVRGNPDVPWHLKDSIMYHRDALKKAGGKVEGHLPDMYKKPNHPTFSDESIYHGFPTDPANVPIGGHWDEKEKTFTPASTNMEHWDRKSLQSYFEKYEPGYKVKFPDWYK